MRQPAQQAFFLFLLLKCVASELVFSLVELYISEHVLPFFLFAKRDEENQVLQEKMQVEARQFAPEVH